MSDDSSYPNRSPQGRLCHGTKKRPCARWRMCARCNDLVARRASARIHQDLQILEDQYGLPEVLALTITLPGLWHGIRRSSIFKQYAFITGRQTLKGLPGMWPMRGLNKRLLDSGVVGGWHFIECTHNKTTGYWNTHIHSILLGNCGSWLPLSAVKVDADFGRSLESSTSQNLRTLGFGERYTLDACQDMAQVLGYCVALAYSSKQALEGPPGELAKFLGVVQPRLVRPFGIARISNDDRIAYLIENDKHDIADVLIAREQAREDKA